MTVDLWQDSKRFVFVTFIGDGADRFASEQDSLAAPFRMFTAQNADIDLIADQHRVELLAVGRDDLCVDFRVAVVVIGQLIREAIHGIIDRYAGPQRAGDSAAGLNQFLTDLVQLMQDVMGMGQYDLA